MKIKTIVLDMDGTLLNSEQKISSENLSALKKAQAQGIQIILASGRGKENMISFAKALNVEYIIAHNGSVVYSINQEKTLFEAKIPDKISKDIFKFLKKIKKNAIFYPNQKPLTLKESPNYDRIVLHFKTTLEESTIEKITNVQKIIVIDFAGDLATKLLVKKLQNKYTEGVTIKRSSPRAIDFNPKGISKASGIEFLSNILNIDAQTTAVFGDAGNDIDMMVWAEYSFGMENCVEEVKTVAKEIIGDNNSNAIANALYKILKINQGE